RDLIVTGVQTCALPISRTLDGRIEDDLAEWLVRSDEAMGRRRFPKWQDAVDEHSEFPRSGQLERALQVFSALRAQSADDPKTLRSEERRVGKDDAPRRI